MSNGRDDGGQDLIPLTVLPDRLAAHFADQEGLGPYQELRLTSAAWIRESGDAGETLGRVLLDLESNLEQTYLLGQPSLAGMGVGAWGLAVDSPELADPVGKARNMLGSGMLRSFLDEEYDDAEEETDDPDALIRAIDLVSALQSLDQVRRTITDEAPVSVMENLADLCADLERRLEGEARHSRRVRKLRGDESWRAAGVARRLTGALPKSEPPPEEAPAALTELPQRSREDAYGDATDAAFALDPPPPSAELSAVRTRISEVAEQALAADPDSPGGRLAVERARRLMARETALTGGALAPSDDEGIDTISLRHALADRKTRTPRPEAPEGPGVTPAPGLPEVPIYSSRGSKGKVIGYLAAGEQTKALKTAGGFVKVPTPGRTRPGWIPSHLLERSLAALGLRGAITAPGALLLDPAVAKTLGGVSRDIARLATVIARETGVPLQMLLAGVGQPPPTVDAPKTEGPRRARGAAMARKRMVESAPISIGRVSVSGIEGRDGPEAAAIINGVLAAVPSALERELRGSPDRVARLRRDNVSKATLEVPITVHLGQGDLAVRVQAIANHLAEVLVRSEYAQIGTLHLGVRTSSTLDSTPEALFEVIQSADEDALLEHLGEEKKDLDQTTISRLKSFFGKDFKDVAVFAGPMAGALARSIGAEAFTHGKRVFFDPKHYRPDTLAGESLLAHEFAHTQQAADMDPGRKEIEAMVAESSYMGWVGPQGASFALEDLDLLHEGAAAADVAQEGVARARGDRATMTSTTGPREDRAKQEDRVKQVLKIVQRMLEHEDDFEAQRIGKLARTLAERLI